MTLAGGNHVFVALVRNAGEGGVKLTFEPCGPKVRASPGRLPACLGDSRAVRAIRSTRSGFLGTDGMPDTGTQSGEIEVIKQGARSWENGHKAWLEGPVSYDYPDVIDGYILGTHIHVRVRNIGGAFAKGVMLRVTESEYLEASQVAARHWMRDTCPASRPVQHCIHHRPPSCFSWLENRYSSFSNRFCCFSNRYSCFSLARTLPLCHAAEPQPPCCRARWGPRWARVSTLCCRRPS